QYLRADRQGLRHGGCRGGVGLFVRDGRGFRVVRRLAPERRPYRILPCDIRIYPPVAYQAFTALGHHDDLRGRLPTARLGESHTAQYADDLFGNPVEPWAGARRSGVARWF